MSACLIVYPVNYALDHTCPRCQQPAGDHPAPLSLVPDLLAATPDLPVRGRPTYRDALVTHRAALAEKQKDMLP